MHRPIRFPLPACLRAAFGTVPAAVALSLCAAVLPTAAPLAPQLAAAQTAPATATASAPTTVSDLKAWTIEGDAALDPAKPSPGNTPSLRLAPNSRASLKLRDTDGSGKITFHVFDDATVATPDKKKSVGPRWGTTAASGRILVGGIMYAPFLQPAGSICLLDTDPKDPAAWLPVKFLGTRASQPGWSKWELEYHPEKGLIITIDGKLVPTRHFDWNTSKAEGFNGITFYGDASPGAGAQTIYIGDITHELGPPMKVKPGSAPSIASANTNPAAAKPTPVLTGPVPEEETDKLVAAGGKPVPAKMAGFVPGPRLIDDLKDLRVQTVEGYDKQHPRLRFSPGDKEQLQQRARDNPALWEAVIANANSVRNAEPPSPQWIREGTKYWIAEKIESAALAWFVTGDAAYKDAAIRWMVAHCKQDIWGDTYRPNLDLIASWYLYHISIAYDILKNEMSPEDRKIVSKGIADHARHIYVDADPRNPQQQIRYDQNHTYIPNVAAMTAALALLDELPEARHWLTRSYAILRRSRYVQNEDGYYYEGFGYWTYALNWHARGAELLQRATGEPMFNIPVLRDTWLFGLHLSLPGTPGAFDLGDCLGWGADGKLKDMRVGNYSMMWEIGSQNVAAGVPNANADKSRTVADMFYKRWAERDYPSAAFLYFNPAIKAAPIESITPYHYFEDQDVVAWRSDWTPDATVYLFRCGPPLGHKAAAKFRQLKDWTMNAGHVHPDIGAFWIYAKGAYLAVDTGYTAEKYTREHNTLLIDDKGQAMDGSYHNDRGVPYEHLDGAKITAQYLSPEYGFAAGTFGSAYTRQIKGADLRRALLMTKRYLLVIDDLQSETPRKLTWLCHAVEPFKPEGAAHVSRLTDGNRAALAVIPLAPTGATAAVPRAEATMVLAGISPKNGKIAQRGNKLTLSSPEPTSKTRFINLLVPLAADEKLPEIADVKDEGTAVSLTVKWPDGKSETVKLDLTWKTGSGPTGPAAITVK